MAEGTISAPDISTIYLDDEPIEGDADGDLHDPAQRRISIEKADRSLFELKRWYDEGDLDLTPDWQRNFVWNRSQSSKLIESFLLDIPVPVLYLAKSKSSKYEVIDGKQRLWSAFEFLANSFSLQGLDVLEELEGKSFKELDGDLQRKLQTTTIRSFELGSETDSNVHFLVFERLNTGGTKLNAMEIRNCIYRGNLNDLIRELSENQDFVKTINQKNFSTRMKDREFVLRFLAFYEKTHLKYTKSLKSFLNGFFSDYQDTSPAKLDEYRRAFEHCMRVSYSVFGEHGFRLQDINEKSNHLGGWLPAPNIAVFQAISTSFSEYDRGILTRSADAIREEYLDLVSSKDSRWRDVVQHSTGSPDRVRFAFEEWRSRLRVLMDSIPRTDRQRTFSRSLKETIFQANAACRLCGQEITSLDDAAVDHIEHYWRGGATIPENARLVHRYCNSARGGRD